MTGDGPDAPSPGDVLRQLHEAADRLMAGWTAAGWPGGRSAAGPPSPPRLPALPATVSAEQVQRVLDDLAARRAQVQALRDQLTTFDEALGALETNLRPMAEWTRTWAALEKSVTDFFRPPGGGAAG
jgi:hypothetical protein